jgi:hypothetical protein
MYPDWLKRSNPSSHRFMTTFNKLSNATSPARQANSSRCIFNKRFSLSPWNSTQWRPFLPKEGGLIQVDISVSTHLFQLAQNNFLASFLFLAVFRFLNFQGHFKGLNEVFWGYSTSMIAEGFD